MFKIQTNKGNKSFSYDFNNAKDIAKNKYNIYKTNIYIIDCRNNIEYLYNWIEYKKI